MPQSMFFGSLIQTYGQMETWSRPNQWYRI